MAAAAPPAPPATPTLRGVQPLRAGEGHSFFWRKLHSLTGIVPIGAFLIEHIVSNFETLNGPLAYAQQVKFLNSLPLVRVLEWVFIFIPLAYPRRLRRLHRHPRPLQRQRLPLGRQLDVSLPARHRPHRLRLHHPARLASALQRHLASRAPRRSLRQGPARALQPLDARRLRHRHDRHHLALRLRHLALRRQVGHHPRRKGPQELRLRLRRRWHRPLPHGPRQHLRRRHRTRGPDDVMPTQSARSRCPRQCDSTWLNESVTAWRGRR